MKSYKHLSLKKTYQKAL